MQKQITDALLNIHNCLEWRKQLEIFNFVKFEKISSDHYLVARSLVESSKNLNMDIAYY